MSQFQGVVPALITPMNAEGQVDEEALRKVVEFNIEAGVHGFWVCGGTGESILLDDEENERIAAIVVEQGKGRVANIIHVGAPTTARSAKLAENAARVGAEAICCVPPFFYRRTDEEIVEHYRVVAAAAALPLFAYNLPSATGVEIDPPLMRKIQDGVPQLKGLKHSVANLSNLRAFARMGLVAFTGSCHWMLPAMTLGAVGCVDGPPGVMPELWVAIWEAYRAGDLVEAEAAQNRASEAVEALLACGGGFHATAKAAIGLRLGVDCGSPRPPALPLASAQREALERAMKELGLKS
jgi:N-acetylneuraminate lyase